ncbi:MAG: LLM class flavin-dependent oxidoreductase [Actinobacteria bacterium]|nr:LLM class flavin-dependent oxidoreductase [Actinomycetota bacterium]
MSDRVPLSVVGDYARRVEKLGYDVLHVPETIHDSITVSILALQSTTRLRVQSSLTLAFPRSPMLLALQAWDASATSGGRFDLGLATQIRQNIEGRFGVSWSDPLHRMEDYVTVVRAIWKSFSDGSPLNIRTASYTIDRLQPFFNPGPLTHDAPRILLGGVNPRAIELAGRCADWFVTHPTNSHPRFVRERVSPVINGVKRMASDPLRIITASPLITGPTGDWSSLATLMSDDVLDTLLPTGTWDEMPNILNEWYSGLVDGLLVQPPEDTELDDRFRTVLERIGDIEPRSS